MTQPTNYTPTTDFSQQESINASGRSTVNTAALDAEFANIETTLDQTVSNLSLIQRDDGRLKDVSVEIHTISPEVLNLIGGGYALRGLWAEATVYAVNDICSNGAYTYVCRTAHTSGGSFDGQYWTQFGFTSGADAAQAAAAAQGSATSAAGSATAAGNSATAAAASASSVSGVAASALASASTATTKAGEASASAVNAAASAAAAALIGNGWQGANNVFTGTNQFTQGISGSVLAISPSGGIGYGTGAGGTVTQATSKGTAVTLNKPCGQITMHNASLAGGASVQFTLNNSLLIGFDNLFVTANWSGNYSAKVVAIGTGIAAIIVKNETGGALSDALVLNFVIIKGVLS